MISPPQLKSGIRLLFGWTTNSCNYGIFGHWIPSFRGLVCLWQHFQTVHNTSTIITATICRWEFVSAQHQLLNSFSISTIVSFQPLSIAQYFSYSRPLFHLPICSHYLLLHLPIEHCNKDTMAQPIIKLQACSNARWPCIMQSWTGGRRNVEKFPNKDRTYNEAITRGKLANRTGF